MSMRYAGPDISYIQGAYTVQGWENFGIMNASRANVGFAVGSYYHYQVDRFRQAGREVGHYFFNGNYDAIVCADFFVDNLYDFRQGDMLWLDVEAEGGTGTVAWAPAKALAFCLRVFQRTGVMPGVYLNKSLENGYDWSALVAAGIRLWSAYYQGGALPYVRNWPEVSMIQWTSTPIDTNAAAYTQAEMAGSATPADEEEEDMSYSLIKDAQSATIFICSTDRKGRVGVTDIDHIPLLRRYRKNDAGDPMFVSEMEICESYLDRINPAPTVDVGALSAELAKTLTPILEDAGSGLTAEQITAAVQSGLTGAKIQIDSDGLVTTILDAAAHRLSA